MITTRTSDQPRKPPKTRKCRICRQEYRPWSSTQRVCSPDCAVNLAVLERNKRELTEKRATKKELKAQKKADKERLIEIQRPQYFLKKTERVVNAYCRERDREQPCISCGTYDAATWHAGHWIPVGRSSFLRYDPANIHKQCDACNVFKAGNSTEYEKRLPARIGQAEFDRIKYAPREKKWSREELAAIETDFRAKLRELKVKNEES